MSALFLFVLEMFFASIAVQAAMGWLGYLFWILLRSKHSGRIKDYYAYLKSLFLNCPKKNGTVFIWAADLKICACDSAL